MHRFPRETRCKVSQLYPLLAAYSIRRGTIVRVTHRDGEGQSPVDLWITAAVFVGNLLLLGPWLAIDFSNQPWNNGYIYVGIARMFRDLSWTWDPLHYGGTPFLYIYPPFFHVLVGLIPFVPLGRAFHIVAGIGYALVSVSLYVLARQLFHSRIPAIFAALAYSAFPSLGYILTQWRALAHPYAYAPWSFIVLTAYDEAPHAFGFSFALLAIAAAWRRRWTLASLLAAAVFLTNWPALIGLGFPLVGIAVARTRERPLFESLASVAGVLGTGYGLSAFWMTSGYFVNSMLLNRIVLRHTLFADPWNSTSWMIFAVSVVIIGFSFWSRLPPRFALILVWAALSGLVVISYSIARNYLLPFPHRYMLEFNAAVVLLVAALISLTRGHTCTVVGVVIMAVGAGYSFRFVTHSWKFEPQTMNPRTTVAYQLSDWLKDHAAGSRTFVAGELETSLNIWTNVAQAGGTQQDIRNFLIAAAGRQVAFGCGASSRHIGELWLRALNVPIVVVHGPSSREYYHWFAQPERFDMFPIIWDDGAGDSVRHLPNFDAPEAVVVDLAALAGVPPIASTADERFLQSYVNWAAGKRPVAIRWISTGEASFDVDLAAGEAVLLKINNDAGWAAAGATIEGDPIGFQLLRMQPGPRHVVLRFGASWDVWLGRSITLVTVILLLARVRGGWIAAAAVIPAMTAWAVLISLAPRAGRVAEDTFVRVRPPLIGAQGIVESTTYQQPPLKRGQHISIYGANFGGPRDSVHVWIGDQQVSPDFHSLNQINFRLPGNAPPFAPLSVEVNGCRGNEFTVATK
jgi:hypothetical protein